MRNFLANQPDTIKKTTSIEVLNSFKPTSFFFARKDNSSSKSKIQSIVYLADRVFIEGYCHKTVTIPYSEVQSIELNSENELVIEVKIRGVLTLKTC